MLRNFWYAVEFSAKLTSNKPLEIKLLGRTFALYRNQAGKVVALDNRCAHKGGALGRGIIDEGCLRCPYHGWKYDTEGRCIEIPANSSSTPIPQKARVASFPIHEKYGYIWLFVGDLPESQRPPIPDFPDLLDPTLRAIWDEFRWEAHYTRVIENGMDLSHAAFVHSNAFGNRGKPEIEKYKVNQQEWGASATITTEPKRAKGVLRNLRRNYRKYPTVRLTAAFYMPNLTLIEVIAPNGFKIVNIGSHLPLDENTTLTKWVQLRSFLHSPLIDWDARRRGYKIFTQDREVVEPQQPKAIPYDLGAELHVPSDALQIEYRKMRNKCLDLGWGVEMPVPTATEYRLPSTLFTTS